MDNGGLEKNYFMGFRIERIAYMEWMNNFP